MQIPHQRVCFPAQPDAPVPILNHVRSVTPGGYLAENPLVRSVERCVGGMQERAVDRIQNQTPRRAVVANMDVLADLRVEHERGCDRLAGPDNMAYVRPERVHVDVHDVGEIRFGDADKVLEELSLRYFVAVRDEDLLDPAPLSLSQCSAPVERFVGPDTPDHFRARLFRNIDDPLPASV